MVRKYETHLSRDILYLILNAFFWQSQLDRISEQLEPDEVEEDYFR